MTGNDEVTATAAGVDVAQLFETFVKEKTALLNYVHDLVRYAAKLNSIDSTAILEEEVKEDQIKIKSEYDCQLITHRVNAIVSTSASD